MEKKYILVPILAIGLIAAGLIIHQTYQPEKQQQEVPATIQITTGATDSGNTPGYGLGLRWQQAYDGSSTSRSYYLNRSKPSTTITEECGNCHMEGWDDAGTYKKYEPPYHPVIVNGKSGSNYKGDWFYDDGNHRGPNTQLASQYSGIMPNVQCGACHTPTNPSQSFAEPGTSLSNDPHSVHREVLSREGCIRCHSFDSTTFSSDWSSFNQSNATRSTYGIANPINMTRVWDGAFLSTDIEANYTRTSNGDLSTTGTGWSRYGTTESLRTSQYACGDCHDQFHAEQGFASTGGNGLEFAFNDSAESRKGPLTKVKDTNSWGVNMSPTTYFTCGKCHPTDTHAVHTNGQLNSKASHSQVYDASDQSIINSGVMGAELCDQCHSQNEADGTTTDHTSGNSEKELGLAGSSTGSHNRYPDLESGVASSTGDDPGRGPKGNGYYDPSFPEDCGFCHR